MVFLCTVLTAMTTREVPLANDLKTTRTRRQGLNAHSISPSKGDVKPLLAVSTHVAHRLVYDVVPRAVVVHRSIETVYVVKPVVH